MSWNQPKNAWQWLLLLSPGATSVVFTAFGKLFLSKDNAIGPSMLGLPVAFALCVLLGVLLARGRGSAARVLGLMLLFTFALLVVNFSIAIGGCALMPPKLDFK